MSIEFAYLGDDCGFVVVDHGDRIGNWCSRASADRLGYNEQALSKMLLSEERHWLATGAPPTDYHKLSGWLAYAAHRGVSTTTA